MENRGAKYDAVFLIGLRNTRIQVFAQRYMQQLTIEWEKYTQTYLWIY